MATRLIRTAAHLAGCLALLALTPGIGNAGTVDFDPVIGTVSGTLSTEFEFEVLDGGTFIAILTDLQSPEPLANLGLAITDLNFNIIGFIETPGSIEFDADPGRYLALVGAVAGSETNLGTFGLEISSVPVPAAGWLLMSSLIGVGTLARRRQR